MTNKTVRCDSCGTAMEPKKAFFSRKLRCTHCGAIVVEETPDNSNRRPCAPVSRSTAPPDGLSPSAPSGYSLQNPLVVRALPEEYRFIESQVCPECGGRFATENVDRASHIVYCDRVHEVLRRKCSQCSKTTDFYFDYTATIPSDALATIISDLRDKLRREIVDPVPPDLIAWHHDLEKTQAQADAKSRSLSEVFAAMLASDVSRILAWR